MFTGLWLRICFGFGSQQQTVTITTPGIADIQFAPTPMLDAQHRYASSLSFSHHGSSFADTSQSTANPYRSLFRALTWETGQVFLTIQGNVQHRCSLHTRTRASTRRAVARGRPNSTVRCFLHLDPSHMYRTLCRNAQATTRPCPTRTCTSPTLPGTTAVYWIL